VLAFVAGCDGSGANGTPPAAGVILHHDASTATEAYYGGVQADVDAADAPTSDAGQAPGLEGGSDDGGSGESGDGGPSDPLCAKGKSWKASGVMTSVGDPLFARLGGITPNELLVAWTDSDDSISVAMRPDSTSDFGAPTNWAPSAFDGGVATLDDNGDGPRVALAPSGDQAMVVGASGVDFLVYERTGGGSAWMAGSAAPFAAVRAAVVQMNATVWEPVLGSSSFFYLVVPATGASGPPVLYESTYDTQSQKWNAGVALPNPEFASPDASTLRRPTGVSADGQTLFFFDEVSGIERAAWRSSPTAPFDHFEDVPVAPEATPNGDCSVLYYQATTSDGTSGLALAR
jgi:hypothetical protein